MQGKITVFKDLLKYLPQKKFDEIVKKHNGDKWCKNFFCWDLFIMLLHGQLTGDMSMRTVELSNAYQAAQLKQLGAKAVPLSTLSDACKSRNPDVFMDTFRHFLSILRTSNKKMEKELTQFVHLIDSTPIPLKGCGYEWVKNNYRIKGLKIHTVYDYNLKCPIHFTMTAPNVNDITEGKKLTICKNGIYIFDKGYYDYRWWNEIAKKGSRFVTRLKKDAPYKIIEKRSVKGNLLHDWTIHLTSTAGLRFKGLLRHIRIKLDNKKTIVVITNDLISSSEHIADLYKWRWEIELFFKCLKQNLKIKRFWGKNENAVKLQIITAMIAYILLRLVQIRAESKLSIKQIRIVLRLRLYESTTVLKALKIPDKSFTPNYRGKL
jgi:hypothetical protein